MPTQRLTLRNIDVRSVVRVSTVLYACMFLVFLVAWVILWIVAGALGVTNNVEDFVAKLFALDSFHVSFFAQVFAVIIGGPVTVALGTGANALGAIFYNQIVELTGGVQVDVDTEDE